MSAEWRLSIAFSFNIDFRRAATMAASRAAAVRIVLRPSSHNRFLKIVSMSRRRRERFTPRRRACASAWAPGNGNVDDVINFTMREINNDEIDNPAPEALVEIDSLIPALLEYIEAR